MHGSIFYCVFGCWVLIVIYDAITFSIFFSHDGDWISLAYLDIIFIIMTLCTCTFLFVYKLIVVNRQIGEKHGLEMVATITKIALLGCSTIISFTVMHWNQ